MTVPVPDEIVVTIDTAAKTYVASLIRALCEIRDQAPTLAAAIDIVDRVIPRAPS